MVNLEIKMNSAVVIAAAKHALKTAAPDHFKRNSVARLASLLWMPRNLRGVLCEQRVGCSIAELSGGLRFPLIVPEKVP